MDFAPPRHKAAATVEEYVRALLRNWKATLTGVIALAVSAIFALAGFELWIALVVLGIVSLLIAQALTWRDMRNQRDRALQELTREGVEPVSVAVQRLDDITMGDIVVFRASVRNVGDRPASFRVRVASTDGLIPGPEAPFEVSWRHGNNRWTVEISPDDDEFWFEIGRMQIYPAETLRRIERERWAAAVFFQIQIREGEGPQEMGSAIQGIDTADDLTGCHPSARFIVRHVSSGKVVANKRVMYRYEERMGYFVPQATLEDVTEPNF